MFDVVVDILSEDDLLSWADLVIIITQEIE